MGLRPSPKWFWSTSQAGMRWSGWIFGALKAAERVGLRKLGSKSDNLWLRFGRGAGRGGESVWRRQHGIIFKTLEINMRKCCPKRQVLVQLRWSSTHQRISSGFFSAGPTAPSRRHGNGRDPRALESPTRKSVRRDFCVARIKWLWEFHKRIYRMRCETYLYQSTNSLQDRGRIQMIKCNIQIHFHSDWL